MEQDQKPGGSEPVAQAAPQQPQKSSGNKVVLIVVAVIVGLLIIATVGGYFALRSVKSKISEKIGENMIEKAIETGTGKKVDVDSNNGSISIEADGGKLSASEEGTVELPKDFPSDVYIPSGAKITFAASNPADPENGSQAGFMVMFSTDDSVSSVAGKYKSEMASDGWKLQSEANYGGATVNFKKESRDVMVTVFENQDSDKLGKTNVSITVSGE